MKFENWAKYTSDLIADTVIEELNTGTYIPQFIVGNTLELKRFKDHIVRTVRKKVVTLGHPVFRDRNLFESSEIDDFLTTNQDVLIQSKLKCKDFATKNDFDFYNYNDLIKLQGKILIFNDIDLFDCKSQYLLSKMQEHSQAKNIVIMLINIDDYTNNFDKEALMNSSRTYIVDKVFDDE